jgi:putative transposase
MARPLRIQFEGAVYHITSRGNARQDIFLDDSDRTGFLEAIGRVVDRFGWICHAYCLMDNHYHLLIETPLANLSRGMQLLNGVYTQRFNRRHGRVGHVLQGRFKAIVVEKESHLLELARYVVLNPVRAKVVDHPLQHRWNSYRATAGEAEPPEFLSVEWILSQFDEDPVRSRAAYRRFVKEGRGVPVWGDVRGGILLGTEEFTDRMTPLLRESQPDTEIPRRQRFADRRSLADIFAGAEADRRLRNQRIHEAVMSHGYTLTALQRYLGLHPSTLSRIVKRIEEEIRAAKDKV